jgi:alpha-galactosidase
MHQKKTIFIHKAYLITTLLCCCFFQLKAQSGNLALTPPMGWNSWNLFEDEVSEKLIKEIADGLVSSGMKDAGYQYIVLDDYWVGGRDANNELYPDKIRFPGGMKALADYVHAKGLKLGIYSDAASLTCGGVTGSYNFEEQDAKTFADWGIDYLKYDYCNAPSDMLTAITRYKKMGDALKKTGRPIVYSICEWGQLQPWLWAKAVGGNLWRTTWDIRDTWHTDKYNNGSNGILNVIDVQQGLETYAGPGGWNDPDLLVTGLFGKGKSSSKKGQFKGCTPTEYRTQFALWSLMASPLMVNLDVRKLNEDIKSILLNKTIISINQDSLGRQAASIYQQDGLQIFKKELTGNRYAIGVLNRSEGTKSYLLSLEGILKLRGKWRINEVYTAKSTVSTNALKGSLKSHDCSVYVFSPL